MQNKLTVLFAFAIFGLVLGWAITPAQAHPETPEGCPHKEGHHHCIDESPPEDTTPGNKTIALKMTFDEFGESGVDNIRSDTMSALVDKDGAGVSAGGKSVPNPAAGIHLGLHRKNGRGRQLFLDITCEGIDVNGNGFVDIDTCDPPLDGLFGFFPDCEVGNDFCDLGAAVRPYKVDCPMLAGGECPDVFTMDQMMPQLMSFRLFSNGGLSIEVASAIGGDGSQDPGTCLSFHPDPLALAAAVCTADGTADANSTTNLLVDKSGVNFTALNVTMGDIVRNLTKLSHGAITNVTETTIATSTSSIDWDIGDVYEIRDGGTPVLGAFGAGQCNVTVTAFGDEGDEKNDNWDVVANGAKALICDRQSGTVIGKATLTFGFFAEKKQ